MLFHSPAVAPFALRIPFGQVLWWSQRMELGPQRGICANAALTLSIQTAMPFLPTPRKGDQKF